MKKILVLLFILFFCAGSISFAQEKIDSQAKTERFCEVLVKQKKAFNSTETAILSLGYADSLFSFKDTSIVSGLTKVNRFTTSVDVLNYMSALGWTFVGVVSLWVGAYEERLYFKRAFGPDEFESRR
ncbi:MAG: hypothetical protein P4L51_08260 [Puia sp.]|nr:hypothetical protein [Puia sp.]